MKRKKQEGKKLRARTFYKVTKGNNGNGALSLPEKEREKERESAKKRADKWEREKQGQCIMIPFVTSIETAAAHTRTQTHTLTHTLTRFHTHSHTPTHALTFI